MSAQTLPPSKLLSSRTATLDEAHAFLSIFIANSDATRQALSQDLGLSDQRRIAQALEGIYVPKPVEEVLGDGEEEEQEAEEERVEDTEMGDVDAEAEETVGGAAAPAVDKEKRKADKKARKKQEQMEKAAQREKEKA